MMAGLKAYLEYKDSGSPFIGQVPKGWEVRQVRHIGRLLKGIGGTKEDGVTEGVPCIRYGELYTTFNYFIRGSKSFIREERTSSYTPIQYGDVLFAASGEKIEEIGKSAVNLMQTRAVCGGDVIIFRPDIDVHAPFLGYALDCAPATSQKATMGRGTTIKHVYPGDLKSLAFPLPNLDEQVGIVRFLDWANRQLGQAIKSKRKIIALLAEQKQVIIHRAVTCGIDPSVPIKTSAFPDAGEIPAHWIVLALKHALKSLIDCEHKTAPAVEDSEYRVVRTAGVRDGELRLGGTYCTDQKSFCIWTERGTPKEDDVIFTREAPAGEACVVPSKMKLCLGQRTVLMKPNKDVLNSNFLVFMLTNGPPRTSITIASQGSTVSHFNMSDIGALTILLPPLHEQEHIVRWIETRTRGLISAIVGLEREIKLIQEYRARLIADVVTGKLDVREGVAKFPAVISESMSIDAEPDSVNLTTDSELDDEEVGA